MGAKQKGGAAAASSALAEGVMISDRGAPEIPIDLIDEAPENTRRTSWGNLEELAASMQAGGQKQAGKVRQTSGGRYELIDGARRFRAAKLAGLVLFRAEIAALSDAEAHEERLVLNNQRQDITPLEEADAFQVSRATHKKSVEEIAAKIGRSSAYVTQRLRLLELDAGIRKLIEAERLTPSLALLLANLPQKVQKDVGGRLARGLYGGYGDTHGDRDGGGPQQGSGMITRGDVEAALAEEVHTIKSAPFDTTDPTLVPKAGACTTCAKRTGMQGVLFEEANRNDLCLDMPCWDVKVDALWKLKAALAKATGQEVLDGKAAAEALREAHSYGRGKYVRADQKPNHDAKKTFGEIVGAEQLRILARGERGQIVELVPRDVATQAVKATTKKGGAGESAQQKLDSRAEKEAEKHRTYARQQQEKAEIERDGNARAMGALIAAVESGDTAKPVVCAFRKVYIAALLEGTWADVSATVCKRRGWSLTTDRGTRHGGDEVIVREMADLSAAQLVGLMVEIVATRSSDGFKELCKACGVDLAHHHREAKKAADAKKAEKKAKEKDKAKHAKKIAKLKAKSEATNAKLRAADGGKTASSRVDEGEEDEPDEDLDDEEQLDVDAAEED